MNILKQYQFYVLILVGLIFSNLIVAQDVDKALEYFYAEKYEKAAKEFEEVLVSTKAENRKDITYAELCLYTAFCYGRINNTEIAISYYILCNETYQSIPNGTNEKAYGTSLKNLALLYEKIGKYDQALALYLEAIKNTKKSLGKEHSEYGKRLNNLAEFYRSNGKYDQALPLYLEALENTEKSLGKEHSSYGSILNNLAEFYRSMGKYDKALPLYLEAIGNKEKSLGKEHSEYGTLLNNLASLYQNMGKYNQALPLYLEALEITERTLGKEHSSYGKWLNNLAALYESMGRYDQALPLYLEAIEITEKSLGKDHSEYGAGLNNLAVLYEIMGKYDQALALYLEALEIIEKTLGKEHSEYGARLNNLAALYESMGRYDKALPLYLEALEITEKSLGKGHSEYGTLLNNLAGLYKSMGRFGQALALYLEALENTEKSLGKDHSEYGARLNNLASLYESMGKYDQALDLYFDALENIEESLGKEHSRYGASLNNIALFYVRIGKYDQALLLYLEAIEITEKSLGKEHSSYGIWLNNLAILYESMGKYNQALPLYLEALENTEKSLGKEHSSYGTSLNNLALLYVNMGKYDQALSLHLEALEITENTLGKEHPSYGTLLNNLAEFYKSMGEYDKALLLYIEGIENINNNLMQNFTFLSEKGKEDYLVTVNYNYKTFNSFALQHRNEFFDITTYVFDNALTNRGILLKSTTAMRNAVLSSSDTALISNFDKWTMLNNQISKIYTTPKSKRFQDPKELEEKANLIERQLVQDSKEFSNYNNLQNIDWKDVQNKLKPNEAAIEFISFDFYDKQWTDSVYYCALVLRKEYHYPKMIYLFVEQQLRKAIDASANINTTQLIANLYSKKRGATILGNNNITTYGDTLYKLIWQPLDTLLMGVEKVYYSPSGVLHNISYAAIPTSDSTLLCDSYDLALVSTTANIALNKESNTDVINAAIYGGITYDMTQEEMIVGAEKYKTQMGNILAYNRGLGYSDTIRGASWYYLNGTHIEADNVASTLTKNNISTTLYTGAGANEESFKSLSGRNSPEIIHIATHGFFFPDPEKEKKKDFEFQQIGGETFSVADNPLLRSGLIFAGGNAAWNREEVPDKIEDGILTAYEVSGLDLFNTKLVTLSACETGLGDIQGAEGVYGLQRAFKMAGVDYLIMSLWQVPDKETQEFMDLFYSNWTEGQSIGDAFRATQRSMRYKYEPYYWAGFVLLE